MAKKASKRVGGRTVREVAERAMALAAVSVRSLGANPVGLIPGLTAKTVRSILSPRERAFYFARRLPKVQGPAFSWGAEGAWLLLWAMGYGKRSPGRLDAEFDEDEFKSLLGSGLDELVAGAKPRSMRALEAEQDLVYNAHWSVVDAAIRRRKSPKGLNSEVVYQRHRALNWLLDGEEWDEVTTDT